MKSNFKDIFKIQKKNFFPKINFLYLLNIFENIFENNFYIVIKRASREKDPIFYLYSTAQCRCLLTRRSELARALIVNIIECTITIIIIVILVRSLFLVDIMCSLS